MEPRYSMNQTECGLNEGKGVEAVIKMFGPSVPIGWTRTRSLPLAHSLLLQNIQKRENTNVNAPIWNKVVSPVKPHICQQIGRKKRRQCVEKEPFAEIKAGNGNIALLDCTGTPCWRLNRMSFLKCGLPG